MHAMRNLLMGVLATVVLAGGAACATAGSTATQSAPAAVSQSDDYVIGASDVLAIRVWKNEELSVEVPVRPDGRISVPLLNDVQAAGLTAGDLKAQLTEKLQEFIASPEVTVVVIQVNSKMVYLVGEVQRDQAIELNRRLRVLDAIALAGGFTPYANKGNIKIIRPDGDGTVEHKFDYNKFVKGKAPESNLVLMPGDTIVVPD